MSPRAYRRLKPKQPDADADYLRAWNEGWQAGFAHAYANIRWYHKQLWSPEPKRKRKKR